MTGSGTIVKIPAELFALAESSRFEGVYELGTLAMGPDDYAFAEPLQWFADITNTGSALLVSGQVTGTGSCPCSRCLEPVAHEFHGQVEGYYLIGVGDASDKEEWDDGELGEDEFEALPDDHVLDLSPLLNAALIVDAPDMPLCKPDCAGLCPSCGANLNDGDCGCGPDESLEEFERLSNPFSVLADYKFD